MGSVFGFLGPNGSGKTTTIRLLLGLIRADAGRVILNGTDLRKNRSKALSGIGAIVETPTLYPNLTGRDILTVSKLVLGLKGKEIDRVLEIVDLLPAADRHVKTYSLGMRQRLALARALMGTPKLLMLDEPTNGLDPAGIADMRRLIKTLPDRSGTTVFVSSHQLSEMEQMADHCALIKSGKLLFQGKLDRLMADVPVTLEITTDAPERAQKIALKAGLNATVSADELIISSVMDRAGRAELISTLVQNDCAVSEARLCRTTLEQLFLSLTADTGATP